MFSLTDNHIIVNYHYVEEPRQNFRGAHPCPPEEFERQILFLREHYAFAGIPEVYEAARKGSREKLCAITFDDGTHGQYENAAPFLQERGIPATFFIITKTFEKFVPLTHKLHALLSRFGGRELATRANAFFEESGAHKKYTIPFDERLNDARSRFDDIPTANFKETITILPPDLRKAFLQDLLKEAGIDERVLAQELFMVKNEVEELHARGFAVGSHTHNHLALDTADEKETRETVAASSAILNELTGEPPRIFSYPQGGRNEWTAEILKESGFQHAVTLESRGVTADDGPFLLPRFDANHIRDAVVISNN